jgi:hypothetical protein
VDGFFYLTLGTFIIVLGVSFFWDVPSFPVGLLSIPALHGLCRRPRWRASRLLLLFGEYTFVIYLMNTMVTGLGKGLLIKMDAWAGLRFALFAPLLLPGGLFVPIILKTCVFSKIPSLDRITY